MRTVLGSGRRHGDAVTGAVRHGARQVPEPVEGTGGFDKLSHLTRGGREANLPPTSREQGMRREQGDAAYAGLYPWHPLFR
jgi:hypothetical protein